MPDSTTSKSVLPLCANTPPPPPFVLPTPPRSVSNDTPFSISHQLLALYGSGAPPESLEKAYKGNEGYQRPTEPVHGNPAKEFQDWAAAKPYLGKEEHYADFLVFFQGEIDRLGGWENTLLEYMFKGDERSEDMLIRMWAGESVVKSPFFFFFPTIYVDGSYAIRGRVEIRTEG